jgi:hypothetical protein
MPACRSSRRSSSDCTTTRARTRRALFDLLAPEAVPLLGHPWKDGFNVGHSPVGRLRGSAGRWDPAEMPQDWTPLAPARVCEVAYDRLDTARFRHPARFVRWRPDREPRSCTFDQLALAPDELAEDLFSPAPDEAGKWA